MDFLVESELRGSLEELQNITKLCMVQRFQHPFWQEYRAPKKAVICDTVDGWNPVNHLIGSLS